MSDRDQSLVVGRDVDCVAVGDFTRDASASKILIFLNGFNFKKLKVFEFHSQGSRGNATNSFQRKQTTRSRSNNAETNETSTTMSASYSENSSFIPHDHGESNPNHFGEAGSFTPIKSEPCDEEEQESYQGNEEEEEEEEHGGDLKRKPSMSDDASDASESSAILGPPKKVSRRHCEA